MEENTQFGQTEVKKRPGFLTALCILTYIGSGLSLLFGILFIVAAAYIASLLSGIPGMESMGGDNTMMVIVGVLLSAASIVGAAMMWKLKKMGFYIYAAAQVIALVIGFSVMGLIFTALFIVLYYLNFKHME